MKSLTVIIMILLMQWTNALAQNPNANELNNQKETQTWYSIEQIVALMAHLKVLKKGYEIVQKGHDLIGKITGNDHEQHGKYFASLKQVKSAIENTSKVAGIIALQKLLLQNFQKLLDDCQNDENFTPEEISYLAKVNINLIRWSEASIDELRMVITSEEAQMKDDERIERIDSIYEEMKIMVVFSRSFANSTRLLSLQRMKETKDIDVSEKIFQNL